ncbi:MAG: hypothetical protein V8Q30_12880 [Acutalibacteraceae bacterium]
MKAAILTMFTGLLPTYSLVNVAADQIRMPPDARIEVRMPASESCPHLECTLYLPRPTGGMGAGCQHPAGQSHHLE